MSPTIVLLADDLTSALDGAAPFAGQGLSATVLLEDRELKDLNADVTAVDLDSRFLAAGDAQERFERISRLIPPEALLYKTVDSTLRGNIGAETLGALRGSRRHYALVAPAFPAAGRTTVGGHQFVNGVPVERTAFAQDVRSPVTTGRLIEHLRVLDAGQYKVHDASLDSDLDELVSESRSDPGVIWVGSPGLAAALARAMPRKVRSQQIRPANALAVERVLVVVGSLHEANYSQLQSLAAVGARVVMMAAEGNPDNSAADSDRIRHGFANAAVVALVSPRLVREGRAAAPDTMSSRLASLAIHCAAEFDGLVLTGGDTARQVVNALRASRLDLHGEVEAGVPFGMLTSAARCLPIVTKAGGFGGPSTLVNCVERVRAACWTES